MNDVTFGIKTFMRPGCIRCLLESIELLYPDVPVVLVDDSAQPSIDPERWKNLTYCRLPFDTGLGAGRNAMIDLVKTKYCLYLDDDFVLNEHSKIEKFKTILDSGKADLIGGFVQEKRGGRLHTRQYHGLTSIQGGQLRYRKGSYGSFVVPYAGGNLQCMRVDITLNFFLASTDLLQQVKWDAHCKINTHSEFFLRAKQAMRIAFCPEVGCFHAPRRPGEYSKYRNRRYKPYILKKHGAKEWHKKGQWH